VIVLRIARPTLVLVAVALSSALALASGRADVVEKGGTLIAVFAMKSTLLLCSDGRIVRASDGAVLREDYRKIHRLTTRVGLLTAGRELPGLLDRVTKSLGGRTAPTFDEVAEFVRLALTAEWRALPSGPNGKASGRAFVYVTGFDEHDAPRLVQMDSAITPAFQPGAVPLLDHGTELDVAAIATTMGPNEDVSALIVTHVDRLARTQPSLDRLRLLQSAFESSKAELSLRNPRIGGATFAALITPDGGYRDLAGR
jgi:hypothetical protein